MLILIGTVPTAYTLNRAMPASQMEQFFATSKAASAVIAEKAAGYNVLGNPRPAVTAYVSERKINEGTYPSLAALVNDMPDQPLIFTDSWLASGEAFILTPNADSRTSGVVA